MTNTIIAQPTAVSLLTTDYFLTWQGSQSPSTRKTPVSALTAYYARLAGTNTFTAKQTISSGGIAVTGNSSIVGTLSVSGALSPSGGVSGQLSASGGFIMPNNTALQSKDSGGTARNLIYLDPTNNTDIVNAGAAAIRFLNQAQNAVLLNCDNSGNVTVTGTVTGNIVQTSGQATITTAGWAYTPFGPSSFGTTLIGYSVISTNSNMLAINYYASSDVRLKRDIKDISEEESLQWLNSSRPVTYLKLSSYDAPDNSGVAEAGFIAQDQVRAGYGRYVGTGPAPGMPERIDDDGFRSLPDVQLTLPVTYQVAYLTRALQATTAKLESALARIEILEAREGIWRRP